MKKSELTKPEGKKKKSQPISWLVESRKHVIDFHGKKKLFGKIKILVQIGEPAFLNVDDTTLKLCSFPILFFSLLMVSICVCFILREGFCGFALIEIPEHKQCMC